MNDINSTHLKRLLNVNLIEIKNIKKSISKLNSYCDSVQNNTRNILNNIEQREVKI